MVVMQEQSITRASSILNITRTPVSKMITELEALIGCELITRTSCGVEPTVIGKMLYDKIHPIYNIAKIIESEINEFKKINFRIYIDVAIPIEIYQYINVYLSVKENTYSVRRVDILEMNAEFINERDIIITLIPDFMVCEGMSIISIPFKMSVLGSSDYTSDIVLPLLVRDEEYIQHVLPLYTSLTYSNSTPSTIRFIQYELSEILYLVSSGVGVTALPSNIAAKHCTAKIKEISIPREIGSLYIVYNKNKSSRQAALLEELLVV
jgi:DNA-binding transcriptional LysR family regulator